MTKQYWYIILTYIIVQFSGPLFGQELFESFGLTRENAFVWWTVSSFGTGLLVVFMLLRAMKQPVFEQRNRSSVTKSALWAVGGIFLAMFAQNIAALIEVYVFNVELGSENTEMLYKITKISPFFIVVTSVLGPIYEEIIFRKILFGELMKKMNFWFAAIISSIIFGAIHVELEHLLIYSSIGFVFAFLYYKTRRIWVPIFAHVTMNTLVILVRFIDPEKLEEWERQMNEAQAFIGGWFL
ncbi:type II CAAX endopeptidase family protein [Bacillus tianshenii]|nr:type II CAAX endopeptidase family protein [Bacillus tianshenii]